MDQQNIDRLFREKLDGLEVKPSPQAWAQVEKQIRPAKTQTMYWVAASISLLFITWLVWPKQDTWNNTPILSEVDHPTLVRTTELDIPVAIDLEELKATPKAKKLNFPKATPKAQFALETNEIPKQKEENTSLPEIETKTMVAMENIEIPVEELIQPLESSKEDFRTVKITYIASSQKAPANTGIENNDSTGVLKKFIAFAEKIDPGEVLADFKTAKDNLINSGFKNKKDRSSLNP